MDKLAHHRAYLDEAWRVAQAAPLSARKAMLLAMLIDAFIDRQCTASGADDILDYRQQRAAASPALAQIMDLCAQRDGHLVIEAVRVPIAEYGALSVEDFMVSLYNDHSVQRVRLVRADGSRHDMQDLLRAAIAALEAG